MTQARSSIPRVSPKSRQYVEQVLGFGFHNTSSVGMSGRLEKEFAVKFGAKYGVLHANGTATMHLTLLAADVGVGDEVIVPALTMDSFSFQGSKHMTCGDGGIRIADEGPDGFEFR